MYDVLYSKIPLTKELDLFYTSFTCNTSLVVGIAQISTFNIYTHILGAVVMFKVHIC